MDHKPQPFSSFLPPGPPGASDIGRRTKSRHFLASSVRRLEREWSISLRVDHPRGDEEWLRIEVVTQPHLHPLDRRRARREVHERLVRTRLARRHRGVMQDLKPLLIDEPEQHWASRFLIPLLHG